MNKLSIDSKNLFDSGHKLIKALCAESAYDHKIESVRIVETHISWVLLTGQYAYKIKKPVSFGFLDFSTLEKRRFFCAEEIRLNRRLAADIYLEVVPITGTPDDPKIGGAANVIEYAVKMTQFSAGRLLSERAECRELGTDEIEQIARVVADFHEAIERTNDDSPYGDALDIKHWFDENFDQIEPLLEENHYIKQLRVIQNWGDDEWSNKSSLMQLRKQQGHVRECHGDLHLNNITCIDGRVMLFDCIEFNPMLRWIDVISEVAFLMIDLMYFGYQGHAFRFLNQYLQYTGDYHGLSLLRYYLVYRALVLGKVSLLRMQQCQGSGYRLAHSRFSTFMNLAERYTRKDQVVLMVTHGYSGSGKSTFARHCSESIGALHLRSDIERKRLFGFKALDNTDSDIDQGIYTEEAGMKTYQHLANMVKPILNAGFSVIIDAAFLKIWQRDMFRQIATELTVQFLILDFTATDEELAVRIRKRKNDASEASLEVLQQQRNSAQPLSQEELTYTKTVDTMQGNALDTWLEWFRKKS